MIKWMEYLIPVVTLIIVKIRPIRQLRRLGICSFPLAEIGWVACFCGHMNKGAWDSLLMLVVNKRLGTSNIGTKWYLSMARFSIHSQAFSLEPILHFQIISIYMVYFTW